MDEFQIISLYPPVKQNDLNDTMFGTDSYSGSLARGPPAGNYRIQEGSTQNSVKRGKRISPKANINGSTLGSEDPEDKPLSKQQSNNHIMLEKSLPLGIGEESLASQWFDYKN